MLLAQSDLFVIAQVLTLSEGIAAEQVNSAGACIYTHII